MSTNATTAAPTGRKKAIGHRSSAIGNPAQPSAVLGHDSQNTSSPEGATEDGGLPSGWQRVKLGQVADVIMGQAPRGDETNFDQQGTVFVKAGEFGPVRPIVREWTTRPLKLAKSGDVLICVVGATCGKLNLSIDCAIGRSVAALRPSELTFDTFLHFQLMPKVLQLRAGSTGSAQGVLSRDVLTGIDLVLPPLPEQRRIVAEIEKQFTRLEAGVAALRRVQAHLKRYRAAVLKAACEGKLVPNVAAASRRSAAGKQSRDGSATFETGAELLTRILAERRQHWEEANPKSKSGHRQYREPAAPDTANLPPLPEGWTWATVEQLGDVQLGRQRSPKNVSKNYPTKYIRAANITERGIDVSDVLEMEFSPAERERFALRDGDIVLSEASGSPSQVGKPAVWRDELPLCCFQNTVLRLRPAVVGSKFVLVAFQHCYVNGVFAKVAGGVGINHLGAEKFSEIPFPLPPLAEQTRIVVEVERRLSVVEELELVVSANLQRATRLRQSILQKAFTGELV